MRILYIPARRRVITADTWIYIYFDSSGSMGSTLQPLLDMREGNLRQTLLPVYDNDPGLYDARVQVVSNATERTFYLLNFLGAPAPSGNIIVMVFQDEASTVYHSDDPSTWTGYPGGQYQTDLTALLARMDALAPGSYSGMVFQVATPGTQNNVHVFKPFLQAVKLGQGNFAGSNGLAGVSQIRIQYDVLPGVAYSSDPAYYLNLILDNLRMLGYRI